MRALTRGDRYPELITLGDPASSRNGSRIVSQRWRRFTISSVPGMFSMPCREAVSLAVISSSTKYLESRISPSKKEATAIENSPQTLHGRLYQEVHPCG